MYKVPRKLPWSVEQNPGVMVKGIRKQMFSDVQNDQKLGNLNTCILVKLSKVKLSKAGKIFVYINIFFFRPRALIKSPCLLIFDTFVIPQGTIQTHPTPCDLFCTVKSTFFKIEVSLVITGCRKKKQNIRFSVWCAGVAICGCLLVVTIRLLVVCSRLSCLLVVCGSLLVVCGCLWWFVVVFCFSNCEHTFHLCSF